MAEKDHTIMIQTHFTISKREYKVTTIRADSQQKSTFRQNRRVCIFT